MERGPQACWQISAVGGQVGAGVFRGDERPGRCELGWSIRRRIFQVCAILRLGRAHSERRETRGEPSRRGRRGRRWRVILEQQGATKLDQEILNLALSGHLTPHPPHQRALVQPNIPLPVSPHSTRPADPHPPTQSHPSTAPLRASSARHTPHSCHGALGGGHWGGMGVLAGLAGGGGGAGRVVPRSSEELETCNDCVSRRVSARVRRWIRVHCTAVRAPLAART